MEYLEIEKGLSHGGAITCPVCVLGIGPGVWSLVAGTPPPESNKGGYDQVTSSLLENFFKFFFFSSGLSLDMSTGLRKNSFDFFFLVYSKDGLILDIF